MYPLISNPDDATEYKVTLPEAEKERERNEPMNQKVKYLVNKLVLFSSLIEIGVIDYIEGRFVHNDNNRCRPKSLLHFHQVKEHNIYESLNSLYHIHGRSFYSSVNSGEQQKD